MLSSTSSLPAPQRPSEASETQRPSAASENLLVRRGLRYAAGTLRMTTGWNFNVSSSNLLRPVRVLLLLLFLPHLVVVLLMLLSLSLVACTGSRVQ